MAEFFGSDLTFEFGLRRRKRLFQSRSRWGLKAARNWIRLLKGGTFRGRLIPTVGGLANRGSSETVEVCHRSHRSRGGCLMESRSRVWLELSAERGRAAYQVRSSQEQFITAKEVLHLKHYLAFNLVSATQTHTRTHIHLHTSNTITCLSASSPTRTQTTRTHTNSFSGSTHSCTVYLIHSFYRFLLLLLFCSQTQSE